MQADSSGDFPREEPTISSITPAEVHNDLAYGLDLQVIGHVRATEHFLHGNRSQELLQLSIRKYNFLVLGLMHRKRRVSLHDVDTVSEAAADQIS